MAVGGVVLEREGGELKTAVRNPGSQPLERGAHTPRADVLHGGGGESVSSQKPAMLCQVAGGVSWQPKPCLSHFGKHFLCKQNVLKVHFWVPAKFTAVLFVTG